jgi:hypothetical protein
MASLGCDARLARLIERGLEKEREARWQSAAELADALSRWAVGAGVESDVCDLSLRRRFLEPGVFGSDALSEVSEVSSQRAVTFSPQRERTQRSAAPRFLGALRRDSTAGVAVSVGVMAVLGALAAVAVPALSSVQSVAAPPARALAPTEPKSQRAPVALTPAPASPDITLGAADESPSAVPTVTPEQLWPSKGRANAHRRPATKAPASEPAPSAPALAPARDTTGSPALVEAKPAPAPPSVPPARRPEARASAAGNALAYDFGL